MKNNIKHGLLFLGASIICAILFLYLWNTQILDDIISDKVLGIQKLQYNPGFTSTHTEHVFKTKREDI